MAAPRCYPRWLRLCRSHNLRATKTSILLAFRRRLDPSWNAPGQGTTTRLSHQTQPAAPIGTGLVVCNGSTDGRRQSENQRKSLSRGRGIKGDRDTVEPTRDRRAGRLQPCVSYWAHPSDLTSTMHTDGKDTRGSVNGARFDTASLHFSPVCQRQASDALWPLITSHSLLHHATAGP